MANEFERIDNPDSTPGAVSTGYQLQNTNIVSIRVGEDKSVVTAGAGECVLEISGPVDVNGEIYTCNSAVTFTLVTAGKYYIHLAGSGANLTPTIGTGANTFDPDKNARYTDAGSYRVLNWVIYYDGTNSYVHRLTNPQNNQNDYQDSSSPEEYWITADGTWTAKRSKYYTFWMTGKGGNSTTSNAGGSSGTGQKRIFITAGTVWTATFSTSGSGSLSFSDGVTTLTVKNANLGAAGNSSSGMDNYIPGAYGCNGVGYGASSFYGQGGHNSEGLINALIFGSGAGCDTVNSGNGKQGVIRIIG